MEEHEPRYAPGDRVRVSDPTLGSKSGEGEVVRAVRIAQQAHQSVRYLYALRMDDELVSVYVPEEALTPATAY